MMSAREGHGERRSRRSRRKVASRERSRQMVPSQRVEEDDTTGISSGGEGGMNNGMDEALRGLRKIGLSRSCSRKLVAAAVAAAASGDTGRTLSRSAKRGRSFMPKDRHRAGSPKSRSTKCFQKAGSLGDEEGDGNRRLLEADALKWEILHQQQKLNGGLSRLEEGYHSNTLSCAAGGKVDFRFHDIRFRVEVSKVKAALMGEKASVKDILQGVSGAVSSGQILAIIGASGAGKTSLLDVLVGKIKAGTKGLSVTGDVTVNGVDMSRSFFLENAAYVPQEDRLWSALTVRENLMFACKMYGHGMTQADCSRRVDEVVASLGLDSCQDTKVGNIFLKGVSGGQRRRTSIGMELVVHRKIIFLDEPTSGLDAASASEIMALLRRLASETGMIIIMSVHQPSTRVFNSFDQVILLTMGQTAYFGPAVDSMSHFAKLGHTPEGLVNPADYLLEITNSDFSDAKVVQKLADAWFHTTACETLTTRLESAYPEPVEPRPRPGCLSNFRQLRALISRAALNNVRDPAAYALRLVLYLNFSFFLGSVYYRVENTQDDIMDRVFLILWINGFNAFMDMAAVPVFMQEKEPVVKEVMNGQYSVANFCVANLIVQVPFVFLIALCCSPVYVITRMSDDPTSFFQLTTALFFTLLVVESMAQIVGVLIKNFVLAIATFACILATFFIFNGFYIMPDNMPAFWLWVYWISPLRYSWEMMARVAFNGQMYAGFEQCVTCYGETGEQVLDSLSSGGGTNLNDVSLLRNCGILLALTACWRLVHYVVLKRSMF